MIKKGALLSELKYRVHIDHNVYLINDNQIEYKQNDA